MALYTHPASHPIRLRILNEIVCEVDIVCVCVHIMWGFLKQNVGVPDWEKMVWGQAAMMVWEMVQVRV